MGGGAVSCLGRCRQQLEANIEKGEAAQYIGATLVIAMPAAAPARTKVSQRRRRGLDPLRFRSLVRLPHRPFPYRVSMQFRAIDHREPTLSIERKSYIGAAEDDSFRALFFA